MARWPDLHSTSRTPSDSLAPPSSTPRLLKMLDHAAPSHSPSTPYNNSHPPNINPPLVRDPPSCALVTSKSATAWLLPCSPWADSRGRHDKDKDVAAVMKREGRGARWRLCQQERERERSMFWPSPGQRTMNTPSRVTKSCRHRL